MLSKLKDKVLDEPVGHLSHSPNLSKYRLGLRLRLMLPTRSHVRATLVLRSSQGEVGWIGRQSTEGHVRLSL